MNAQAMNALEFANEIRVERAELRKRMKQGKVSLKAVFEHDIDCMRTAKILDVLRFAPAMKETKARRALKACGVPEDAPMKRVGMRERERVLIWLQANYPATLRPYYHIPNSKREQIIRLSATLAPKQISERLRIPKGTVASILSRSKTASSS